MFRVKDIYNVNSLQIFNMGCFYIYIRVVKLSIYITGFYAVNSINFYPFWNELDIKYIYHWHLYMFMS